MEKTETTTTTETTTPKPKKKFINNMQVIVHNESFIVMKPFSESLKAVVAPWQRDRKGFIESGVTVPENRLFRVQKFYEKMKLGKYSVSDGEINFDCISGFPEEFFPKDGNSGWIHFLSKTNIEDGKKVVEIDNRMVIRCIEPIDHTFIQPSKIDFQTKVLKVFPVFFVEGFAVAMVEKDKAVLWITMCDFTKSYVGLTNQNDLNNILHNIRPVFPIFSINITDKKSVVFLKLDGLKQFLSQLDFRKGLLRMEYSFENPKELDVCVIGKCEK